MDDERYATQRSRYLARKTDLRKPEALAVAYSERGYSFNGAAKRMDASESTVKKYMERAMALYGLEIAETILPDEDIPDYERVDSEYPQTLTHEQERERWIQLVDRHQENLPQEWVNEVLEQAEHDGLISAVIGE